MEKIFFFFQHAIIWIRNTVYSENIKFFAWAGMKVFIRAPALKNAGAL